ncbi:MAG: dihydropteroate synthase [Actinobacteria bacterium]|nr:dihydropteroate synthase [Actinomycetota bacterium]
MLIIGENISVISQRVSQAIKDRDKKVLQEMAKLQSDAGADYVDVNIGPATKNGPDVMKWVVTSIQEAVDIPLALDTKNVDAVKAGLEVHRGKAMINSTLGERSQLEVLMPLAKEYNAAIVGLAMTEKGVPRDTTERCEVALNIIAAAQEFDIPMDDLYLDPLTLPVAVAQPQAFETLEGIKLFKQLAEPSPRTIVGLSNLSQSSPPNLKSILNSTFLIMLLMNGLDAAIINPLDKSLMGTLRTFDILQNNILYAHSYLD